MSDRFAPLVGGPTAPAANGPRVDKAPAPVAVMPVPKNAPARPARHKDLGAPTETWPYLDATGALIGYACRFDQADGEKQFRPLVLFHGVGGGAMHWRWQAWPSPRPLYGLDRLAGRPEAPVIVAEGEKSADAAARLLPGHVVVTSPNGSKSAAHADWSPLRGRSVTIWPDADKPGADYARDAGAAILAAEAVEVLCVQVPPGVKAGWDAADAEAEGWPADRLSALLSAAEPLGGGKAPARRPRPSSAKSDAPEGDEGKKAQASDVLLDLVADWRLWHTPDKVAYASVSMPDGHRENVRIKSEAAAQRLSLLAFEATKRIPSKTDLENVTRLLEAKAIAYGERCKPWMRVGERDGRIYIDTGCDRWRAIEITRNSIVTLDKHDLPFVRSEGMLALPEPEFGSDQGIAEMRRFVNVEADGDFALLVAWMLTALRQAPEYPLIVFNGEQGTGKSTLSRFMRSLIDPHDMDILATPQEDRDLFVVAQHSHVIPFDNLSKVEGWLSDCLCMFATGGALVKRAMHTNADLTILKARKPVILNGIPALAGRADLAQRSITIRLEPVPEEQRVPSDQLNAEWREASPRIFGALLEGLKRGLDEMPKVKLDRLPRMAEFAKWAVATAPGMGIEPAVVLNAYMANQTELADEAFENDIVAQAVFRMMAALPDGEWVGTPTDLLDALSHPDVTPEKVVLSQQWPRKAQMLGSAITRAGDALRRHGIDVRKRHSGKTMIHLTRL